MDKTKLKGIIANRSDEKLSIMCSDSEENTFTMNIYLMGYDEEKRKYVENPEILDKAKKTLAEIGLTLENVEDKIMDEHRFEAYTDIEEGRASINPIKKFIKFNQIKTPDAKALTKVEGQEIISLPVSDYSGFRFNLGFEMTDKDGNKTNYRVSSLRLIHDDDKTPDTFVSLKYITKDAQEFSELLKNNASLSEAKKEDIRKRIKKFNEIARSAKIEEIKNTFDLDFEKLIEEETLLKLRFKLMMIPNSENYYLAAEVLGVVENAKTKENKK